jgi:MinD superfamily P-loop ATPase
MKEIAIISGKGGTGKTSITASLAVLAGEKAVIADCDVDASDMHLLLSPDFAYKEDFYSGKIAKINQSKCVKCGSCVSICKFDAIQFTNNSFKINKLNCEGCGYCSHICPYDAIEMNDNLTGKFYISKTRINNTLVHAELNIGSENSGKLVSKVRKEAKRITTENNLDYIIIDGTPGIGCPVISSITGVDYIIVVTEPSVSGFHDMKRVYELIESFKINSACIINKYDLNLDLTHEIKKYLASKNVDLILEIPYNEVFVKSVIEEKTVVEIDENIKLSIETLWKFIC